jgi:hypothetical protein
MTGITRRSGLQLVFVAALTCGLLANSGGAPDGRAGLFVTPVASALVDQGLAAPAPQGADAAAFEPVPKPGVRYVENVAQATTAPWIDSNAWRFQRGLRKASYSTLPAGSAPLAAAEAFTFGVEAILNPEPADVPDLGRMLQFLDANDKPRLPVMANLGVVDDGSPLMGEILNLLTRRNLLYRVVGARDPALDLTVQLGTADFPRDAAANPSEFAARVRARLGDDRRLVRLYGTSTVIAHLTGEAGAARLYLLAYGGSNRRQPAGSQQGLRVRVLGRYRPAGFAAYGLGADRTLTDVENPGSATEFSVPPFMTTAIVELEALK